MDGHQFRPIRYACVIADFGSAYTLSKQPIILRLVIIVLVHVDNFDAVRSPFGSQPARDSGLRRKTLPMLRDETDRVETGPLETTSDTVKCGFKSRSRYADCTGETHVGGWRVGITFRYVGYGRHDKGMTDAGSDAVSRLLHDPTMLSDRHVRPVLFEPTARHDDRGKAGADRCTHLDPGHIRKIQASRYLG